MSDPVNIKAQANVSNIFLDFFEEFFNDQFYEKIDWVYFRYLFLR